MDKFVAGFVPIVLKAFKDLPLDSTIEDIDSEVASVAATEFVQNQDDLFLHECFVSYQQSRSDQVGSTVYTRFGCPDFDITKIESLKAEGNSRFLIALGSNVGNRLDMVEQACLEMEKEGIKIQRTSGLWETKAMYVEDQANFLNGVCEVHSDRFLKSRCLNEGVLTLM